MLTSQPVNESHASSLLLEAITAALDADEAGTAL